MTKMMNKKLLAGLLCSALTITSVAGTTGVSQAMSVSEARQIAAKYVPTTATYVEADRDDGFLEIEFYDKSNRESFEVLVHEKSKGVKQVESSLDNDRGSKTVKLSKSEAIAKLKKEFPSITKYSIKLGKDDGLYEYKVKFNGKGYSGSAEINPSTGAILESKLRYSSAKSTVLVSKDKAKAIALAKVKDAKIVKIELDTEDGVKVYEVKLVKGNYKYELEINARSGQIMDYDKESRYDD